MTFLNDKEINAQLSKEKLVVNSDPSKVRSCYYDLTIGNVFFPTRPFFPINSENKPEYFCIDPMGIVWIRMKEILNLPENVCGFLFQTNSFSKKGLSILNLSAVSPGYNGPITFIAVNLSGKPLYIKWKDDVARIFFGKLSGGAAVTSGQSTADVYAYDDEISHILSDRENTFLDIETLKAGLSNSIVSDAEAVVKRATRTAVFLGALVIFGVTVIPPLTGYVYQAINSAGYFIGSEQAVRRVVDNIRYDSDLSEMKKQIDQLTQEIDELHTRLKDRQGAK